MTDVATTVTREELALLRSEVSAFIASETLLLDELKFWDWWELLDKDFVYLVPIRVVRHKKHGGDFPENAYHQRDSKGSVKMRLQRLDTGHAWAEEPATRVSRVLGTMAIEPPDEEGVLRAHYPILVYREHPQLLEADIIAGRREDRIVVRDGQFKLLARTVWLAQTTLLTPNLGIFL